MGFVADYFRPSRPDPGPSQAEVEAAARKQAAAAEAKAARLAAIAEAKAAAKAREEQARLAARKGHRANILRPRRRMGILSGVGVDEGLGTKLGTSA